MLCSLEDNYNFLLNIRFKKGGFDEFGADCFGVIVLALKNLTMIEGNISLSKNVEIIQNEYEKLTHITNLAPYKEKILELLDKIAQPVENIEQADFIFVSSKAMPVHFALIVSEELIIETNELIGKSFLSSSHVILNKRSVFFKFRNDLFN